MGNFFCISYTARRDHGVASEVQLHNERPPPTVEANQVLKGALRPIGYEKTAVLTSTQQEARQRFGM